MIEGHVFEGEKKYESTIRFDRLDDDGFREFSGRVKESMGVVRVFIHPLHLINNKEFFEKKVEVMGKEISAAKKPLYFLKKIAEKKSAPPIIIFENYDRVNNFQDGVEESGFKDTLAHPLYILPTIENYPFPRIDGTDEPSRNEEGWIQDSD